jgi:hypothetical protein
LPPKSIQTIPRRDAPEHGGKGHGGTTFCSRFGRPIPLKNRGHIVFIPAREHEGKGTAERPFVADLDRPPFLETQTAFIVKSVYR